MKMFGAHENVSPGPTVAVDGPVKLYQKFANVSVRKL